MAREIVLDTETTGFDPRTGDRLVEIGCIEIEDLLPTGRTYHQLINPERLIPPDAIKVHGITDDAVRGKPKFAEICDALLAFIGDAPIVAHNAQFDRNFVNHELGRCGRAILEDARWIDTLGLAQKRFPGMHNSLDALCKRFKISLAERTMHGALIDARLLSMVYLELRGGKERGLELTTIVKQRPSVSIATGGYGERPRPLAPRITDEERAAHEAFIAKVFKGAGVWAELEKA